MERALHIDILSFFFWKHMTQTRVIAVLETFWYSPDLGNAPSVQKVP